MKNIESKEDIEFLVQHFYLKVQKDEHISFFFTDIAHVDWVQHLPKMYRFWESLLFGSANYKGNPMLVHFPINKIHPIKKHHFEHWLKLWRETVHTHFEGTLATNAITKAENIARLMAHKMDLATRDKDI